MKFVIYSGQIGGLNGVLIGAAAESGLQACSLLGEMPHIFAQLPFPKASLAVLEVFTRFAQIDLDLTELAEQAQVMERKLGDLLAQVERTLHEQAPPEESYGATPVEEPEEKLSPRDRQHIEGLFREARNDRSRAYELKRELDRLDVFRDYEDRFLDLFKGPGGNE